VLLCYITSAMTQQVSPPYYVFITTGNVTKTYNKIKIQLTQYQTYQLSMISKKQKGLLGQNTTRACKAKQKKSPKTCLRDRRDFFIKLK